MKESTWKDCIFDFRGIPTECSNCGSTKIRYTKNSEIYNGKSYGNGYCYLCDNCGAYVGVHNTRNKKPLGRFATKELRALKMECHHKFDVFWRTNKFKRTDCYGYLANKLGLHLRETHFGWFDKDYLLKALDVLNNTTCKDIEDYIKKREIEKPFLSILIRICNHCGRIDINTYARYRLEKNKYVLDSAYSKCQSCGRIKEFTKEELEQELKQVMNK